MAVKLRNYNFREDFNKVGEFLVQTYPLMRELTNWIQPRWEYMHDHSLEDNPLTSNFGLWEDDGKIVAIANHEGGLGEAYFAYHTDYAYLKNEMLDYAEENLFGTDEEGRKFLVAYINDFDKEFEDMVISRGYKMEQDHLENRGVSKFVIGEDFPEIKLPEGFKLKTLEEDNDFRKIHRVLWRGFDHEGEPPEEGVVWRQEAQMAPNFRRDLTVVVEAPDGNFAAYCGIWFDSRNKIAYVEPVATDPDYRRMGLGKAAVLEGIRRSWLQGAAAAYVESAKPFYTALGFKTMFNRYQWMKFFDK